MSDHYKQYPKAGDRQHSGLGDSSEPIETLRIETLQDADGREFASVLTFQGKSHAENWYGGPYPTRELLFHQGSGRTGSLRPLDGLSGPEERHETRDASLLHCEDHQQAGGEPTSNGRPSRLKFPLHVYAIIIAVAFAVAGFIQLVAEVAR